jgi:hypothetical protein
MERVETLCNLLAQKIQNKAPIGELLTTLKMMESELMHLKNITPALKMDASGASIAIAKQVNKDVPEKDFETTVAESEKTIEILQIDEAAVEAELEEIKKIAEERSMMGQQHKPIIAFNPEEEIPTLVNRQSLFTKEETIAAVKELNEVLPNAGGTSLNDILVKPQIEVSNTMQETPVKDLKKAIGVNDRFLYLNELFRGDEVMYERSIKTINAFEIYGEAEFWIRRELKLKLGWDDKYETVKKFDQLIRRRFS